MFFFLYFEAVLLSPAQGAFFSLPVVWRVVQDLIVLRVLQAEVLGGLSFVDAVGGYFHFSFLVLSFIIGGTCVPVDVYIVPQISKMTISECCTNIKPPICQVCTKRRFNRVYSLCICFIIRVSKSASVLWSNWLGDFIERGRVGLLFSVFILLVFNWVRFSSG